MSQLGRRLASSLLAPARWLFGLGRNDSAVHGKAHWMKPNEQRRLFDRNNSGLILSDRLRLSSAVSFQNLCLAAPTGTGKTTRFVIPNLLECTGSAVATDPSGEIFAATSGHLAARGYRVQVLQPADLARSLRFNPLTRFQTPQELKRLATILAENNTGNDEFWKTSAGNILHVCLAAIVGAGDPRLAHLGNVRRLLNHLGTATPEVKKFMAKTLDEAGFSEYRAFVAQDARVAANILSTARAALDLWSDPDVVKLTASNSVDIESLRREKTVIYLIVPEDKIKYFSIVINLFYSACFEYCLHHAGAEALPVFFFLDEFGNLGKLDNFASIATTLRKRRCSLSVILQDLAQLKAIYGVNDAASIYAGGMANKLFFGGLDLETCTYLERVLGNKTAVEVIEDDKGERKQTHGKPLKSSDEIRMLDQKQAILISGRERPLKFAMPPYYESARLAGLAKIAPAKIITPHVDDAPEFLKL